jgi:hypothetical protein
VKQTTSSTMIGASCHWLRRIPVASSTAPSRLVLGREVLRVAEPDSAGHAKSWKNWATG